MRATNALIEEMNRVNRVLLSCKRRTASFNVEVERFNAVREKLLLASKAKPKAQPTKPPATGLLAMKLPPTLMRVHTYDARGTVLGLKASASSSGPNHAADNAAQVRGTWCPNSKTSSSDWLEVEFPPTEATKIVVYESAYPGAITKVVVQGQVVWEGPPLHFGRKSKACVVNLETRQLVSRVRIYVNPSVSNAYPQIGSIVLVGRKSDREPSSDPVTSVRIVHEEVRQPDTGLWGNHGRNSYQVTLGEAYARITPSVLAALEKKVSAGDLPGARFYLWGLWTQTRYDRADVRRDKKLSAREKEDAIRGINARFQQARSLVFGSTPPMETGDDALILASQIDSLQGSLNLGDLTTVRRVLVHVRYQLERGVQLSPETMNKADASYAALQAKEQALYAAGFTASLLPLIQRGAPGDSQKWGLTEGFLAAVEKIYTLKKFGDRNDGSGLTKTHALCFELMLATNYAREKLQEFARSAPDPEWVEAVFVANPQLSFGRFVESARAGVFGSEILSSQDLPGWLIQAHLRDAEAYLSRAEAKFMNNDRTRAQSDIAGARAAMDLAKQLGASQAELARCQASIKDTIASAGSGKLVRAQAILTKAKKRLESTHYGNDIPSVQTQLKSAEAWIAKAAAEGVPAGALAKAKTQLAESETWVRAAYGRLAKVELDKAKAFLDEAKGKLTTGETAFQAETPLKKAEQDLNDAKELASEAGGQGAALQARVTAGLGSVKDLRGQVVANQRMPQDIYEGAQGASWRRSLRSLAASDRGWKILALRITSKDWVNKTSTYTMATYKETRWHRRIWATVAIPDPDHPDRVKLVALAFQLHKMTDGSYRRLELYSEGWPYFMLQKNLPK